MSAPIEGYRPAPTHIAELAQRVPEVAPHTPEVAQRNADRLYSHLKSTLGGLAAFDGKTSTDFWNGNYPSSAHAILGNKDIHVEASYGAAQLTIHESYAQTTQVHTIFVNRSEPEYSMKSETFDTKGERLISRNRPTNTDSSRLAIGGILGDLEQYRDVPETQLPQAA